MHIFWGWLLIKKNIFSKKSDNLYLYKHLEYHLPGITIRFIYQKNFYAIINLATNLFLDELLDYPWGGSVIPWVWAIKEIVLGKKKQNSKLKMLISVGKLGFYSFNKDDFDTGYSVMIERINMVNFISKFDTIHRYVFLKIEDFTIEK